MRTVLSFVAALAPLLAHTATLQAQTEASDGWRISYTRYESLRNLRRSFIGVCTWSMQPV
jgi:hypothetical protein